MKKTLLTLSLLIFGNFSVHAQKVVTEIPGCLRVESDWKKGKTVILKNGKKLVEYKDFGYPAAKLPGNRILIYSGGYIGESVKAVYDCEGTELFPNLKYFRPISDVQGNYISLENLENVAAYYVDADEKTMLLDRDFKKIPGTDGAFYIGEYAPQRPILGNLSKTILYTISVKNDDGTWNRGIFDAVRMVVLIPPKYTYINISENHYFLKDNPVIVIVGDERTNRYGFYAIGKGELTATFAEGKPTLVPVDETSSPARFTLVTSKGTFTEDGVLINNTAGLKTEQCNGKLLATDKTSGKKGLLDATGKVLVPVEYDDVNAKLCYEPKDLIDWRFIPVKRGELWGYYGVSNKEMLQDFKYKSAGVYSKELGFVTETNGTTIGSLSFDIKGDALKQRVAEIDAATAQTIRDYENLIREYNTESPKYQAEIKKAYSKATALAAYRQASDFIFDKMKRAWAYRDALQNKYGIGATDKIKEQTDKINTDLMNAHDSLFAAAKKAGFSRSEVSVR